MTEDEYDRLSKITLSMAKTIVNLIWFETDKHENLTQREITFLSIGIVTSVFSEIVTNRVKSSNAEINELIELAKDLFREQIKYAGISYDV